MQIRPRGVQVVSPPKQEELQAVSGGRIAVARSQTGQALSCMHLHEPRSCGRSVGGQQEAKQAKLHECNRVAWNTTLSRFQSALLFRVFTPLFSNVLDFVYQGCY